MDHLAGFAHLIDAARRSRIVLFAPNATVPFTLGEITESEQALVNRLAHRTD